jgi:hypothetical protein
MIEGCSTTAGYQALEGGFDNSFTDMYGQGSTIQPYDECMFTGGGKKKAKAKKSKKRTPLRKKVSKKTKRLAKMRVKSVKSVEQRSKKLSKRLKQRKVRSEVIDSLSTNIPLTDDLLQTLTPSMQKFVSKIPRGSKSGMRGITPSSIEKRAKKPGQYTPKSKSLIQFSDFRSMPTQLKSKQRAKSKRKGNTR